MKLHELKTDPQLFDDVAAGRKTFEIRWDDRGYTVGDQLFLRRTEHTGVEMAETGPYRRPLVYTTVPGCTVEVTHILRGPVYGLADGWVIMSVRLLRPAKASGVSLGPAGAQFTGA